MHAILRLVILAVLVGDAYCCGKGKKKPGGNNPPTAPTLEDLLGPNVKTSPFVSAGDSPQNSCDGLSCNFDSSCCWSNAQPPADQLNWAKAEGAPDPDKLQKNFHTSNGPDGSYLLTFSSTPGDESQTAQFFSCPVTCSNGDIKVKAKHWATDGVKLQVCSETDPAGPPQNCQDLPSESNGNQDEVTVPKGENQRVVIQATGFTSKNGSVAMVSNVEVACDPCSAETTPTTAAPVAETSAAPPPPPSTVCQDVPCNFEDGSLCKYQSGGNANMNFANQKIPFHNRLTGVPKPGEGQAFAGSYMKAKQGEKSTMTTQTDFDKDYTIRAKYLKDTDGVNFKGCCNDESNCPFDSQSKVEAADYQKWKTASFTCPAGTKQVVLVGENTQGANEGAVAVDDIQVFEAASPPDSASTAVCGAAPQSRHRSRNHH